MTNKKFEEKNSVEKDEYEHDVAIMTDILMRILSGRKLAVVMGSLFTAIQSVASAVDQENKAYIVGHLDQLAKAIIHSPDIHQEIQTH